MGVGRLLKGLFTGNAQVSEATHDAVVRLTEQVMHLGRRLESLEALVDDHHAQFNSFRGRVYAWKRFEPAPEPPPAPQELPLSDPRVSKAELRSRLLQPGKPFKHTN